MENVQFYNTAKIQGLILHDEVEINNSDDEDLVDGDDAGEDRVEEIVDCGTPSQDARESKFDRIIGALEEMMVDPEFEAMQDRICREHCAEFDDSDENKLVYTDSREKQLLLLRAALLGDLVLHNEVFHQYQTQLELAIDTRLRAAVPGFSMEEFMEMLEEREGNLDGEVFEMLLTLSDFDSFKDLMLAYKSADSFQGLAVSVMPAEIHFNEQEEGEERQDLDMFIGITPVKSSSKK